MDLLDALLGDDNSSNLNRADDDASADVDATAKEGPEISSQDQAWLTSSGGSDKKSANNPMEFWDTKILARIHPSKLVWAKNNYFKSGSGSATNHFPARICDDHEGMYLTLGEWPIPEDKRLVEFLSIPKKNPQTPQKVVVMLKDIVPFHARVSKKSLSPAKSQLQIHSGSGSSSVMKEAQAQVESERERRQQQQSMLTFTTSSKRNPLHEWNVDSMCNMVTFINDHYYKAQGIAVEKAIKSKANAYLKASLAYAEETDKIARLAEEELLARKNEQSEEDKKNNNRDSSDDDSIDLATFARQDLDDEAHIRIRPGSWLAYTHKIFKKIMYTRVVEIKSKKAEMPLICENGEVFGPTDQVRVMNTMPDGSCDKAEGSSYKQLSAYKLKKGKCKTLLSLHESSAEGAKNDKLDVGGGKGRGETAALDAKSSSSTASSSLPSGGGKRSVHALKAEESGSSDDDGLVATNVQEKKKRMSMTDYLNDSD